MSNKLLAHQNSLKKVSIPLTEDDRSALMFTVENTATGQLIFPDSQEAASIEYLDACSDIGENIRGLLRFNLADDQQTWRAMRKRAKSEMDEFAYQDFLLWHRSYIRSLRRIYQALELK